MDVVRTYTLKTPLTHKVRDSSGEREEKTTVVNFRKPLAGDLVALDKAESNTAALFHFISYISDVSYAQIEKMEIEDARALMKIGNDFLDSGPTASATSSANS